MNEFNHCYDILGISETNITNSSTLSFNLNLNIPGYALEFVPTALASGGVGMYSSNNLRYSVLERTSSQSFQALWIEIHFENKKKTIICGIIYRQHNSPDTFLSYFENARLKKYSIKKSL